MNTIDSSQNRILQSADRLRNSAISSKGDNLGKSDFMNLFMYQLSNQNPLDPMDSDKMMTSLSQLGSMEQLQALNTKFSELANSQRELIQFSALSFINRKIQIRDNHFKFDGIGSKDFTYNLGKSASSIKANIINSENQLVRQIDLGHAEKGDNKLSWDGITNKGVLAPSDEYSVEIYAYDNNGQSISAEILKEERVSQIKMEGNRPLLKVGDRFIEISDALIVD